MIGKEHQCTMCGKIMFCKADDCQVQREVKCYLCSRNTQDDTQTHLALAHKIGQKV